MKTKPLRYFVYKIHSFFRIKDGGAGGADSYFFTCHVLPPVAGQFWLNNYIYQSINVEFFELPRCFTFLVILLFYAIFCVIFLHSPCGGSNLS